MFIVDLFCEKCGEYLKNVEFKSLSAYQEHALSCEKCGASLRRSWQDQKPSKAAWKCGCPTASGGK